MVGLGIFSTRWQDAEDRFLGTARLNQVSCQLGWSCFIWDKISSLYFGRSPMIPEPPKAGPFIDVTVDEWDMSRPNAGVGFDRQQYPETPSHRTSCCAT